MHRIVPRRFSSICCRLFSCNFNFWGMIYQWQIVSMLSTQLDERMCIHLCNHEPRSRWSMYLFSHEVPLWSFQSNPAPSLHSNFYHDRLYLSVIELYLKWKFMYAFVSIFFFFFLVCGFLIWCCWDSPVLSHVSRAALLFIVDLWKYHSLSFSYNWAFRWFPGFG